MKRAIFLRQCFLGMFFIVLFNTSADAGWGGIEKISPYAGDAIDRIGDIFIKYKVCTDKRRDCSQKEVIAYDGHDSDLYLISYLVTDIEMANEIIQVAIDEFRIAQKNGDNDLTIHLILNKNPHKMGMFQWFRDDCLIKLIINGERK